MNTLTKSLLDKYKIPSLTFYTSGKGLEREDNQRIEQTTGANHLFVYYSCFNKPSAAAARAGRAGTIWTFSGNNIDSQ